MSAGLMQELSRALQAAVDARRQGTGFGTTLTVRHGESFSVGSLDAPEEFRTLETLIPIEKEDVLRNDLGKLAEVMTAQARGLTQQTADLVREIADKTVEATGNNVEFPKDGSPVEAYLKVLRTSEFTVVGESQVNPPTVYFKDPADEERFRRRLDEEMQKPEIQARVQEVLQEKAAEAMSKERERLSRYEGFGEAGDG